MVNKYRRVITLAAGLYGVVTKVRDIYIYIYKYVDNNVRPKAIDVEFARKMRFVNMGLAERGVGRDSGMRSVQGCYLVVISIPRYEVFDLRSYLCFDDSDVKLISTHF